MSNKVIVRSSYKDIKNFNEIPQLRTGVIEQAPASPISANYSENATANLLHPKAQFLKIKQIEEITSTLFAYVLEPDTENGTAVLSQFRPGQIIEINIYHNNEFTTKEFTLCSSPARVANNEYVILVIFDKDDKVTQHIKSSWNKGTKLVASAPKGNFYHQALRDSYYIVGVCDNNGFEPFLSMAEAITDGTLKADLTLIYTERKQRNVAMTDHLNGLAQENKRFRVIYVFSDEHVFKCERGFITKTLLEKYLPNNKYTIFINGTADLLNKTLPQTDGLNPKPLNVRIGPYCNITDVSLNPDYPVEKSNLVFLCKAYINGELSATVPCSSSESIYTSFEKEGLLTKSDFDNDFSKIKIITGEVFIPSKNDTRKKAEIIRDIVYTAEAYPLSNLTIEII